MKKAQIKTKSDFDCQFLVGDLNTIEFEPIFRELTYDWVDLFDKSGSGFGLNFPNSGKTEPLIRLDYIMATGEVLEISSKVIEGGASDHLAVLAKVKL